MTSLPFFKRIVILPTGSYEYHGFHLPPQTDAVLATRVASDVGKRMRERTGIEVEILPTLAFGLSIEHIGLPTTAYVLHRTYYAFVSELVSSVTNDGDCTVVVNGHGGNTHTLSALEGEFNSLNQRKKLFFPPLFGKSAKEFARKAFGDVDAHAGSMEASLLAFYGLVQEGDYDVRLAERVRGSFRFFRTSEIAPEGVVKDIPHVTANAAHGGELHEVIVEEFVREACESLTILGSVIGRGSAAHE